VLFGDNGITRPATPDDLSATTGVVRPCLVASVLGSAHTGCATLSGDWHWWHPVQASSIATTGLVRVLD
jgi:hypothetical protein